MVSHPSKEKTEHPSHGMLGFSNNAVNILIAATTSLPEPEPPEPEPPEPFQVLPELQQVQVPEQVSSPPPSGRR